jgi:hypothetical protein
LKLEAQLEELAELGLKVNPGITVDDFLYGYDRQDFEAVPFDLVLFYLGAEVEREPWGRRICERVWGFDTECIDGAGDYVQIVRTLCRLTGDPDYLSDIADHVDLEAGEAWLEYTVQGRRQHWTTEVNDDWADTLSLSYVMDDLERGGKRFYVLDNGQAMVLFYLDDRAAAELGALSSQPLRPFIPD